MHLLHKECEYHGKSSVLFLPMIDMNPGDKTCILSTLNYLCKLASKHNMPAIVTFDQPLFWKASEIANAVPDDSPIRNVVLLLGSFHTFMNLLGAIGTLMDGSGLKEILETVYGWKCRCTHWWAERRCSERFVGTCWWISALHVRLLLKSWRMDPGFQDQVEELERLYMLTGASDLNSLLKSDCIRMINETVSLKKDELAGRNS